MKASSPLLSIGMPVYNGELFLCEAIDSLLSQSYKDFELIISDNASSDNTEVICLNYQKEDKRVRYIKQPKNIGALPNFQFVLNEAKCEYFMWAACDDKWDSRWVELLLNRLTTSKSRAVFGRVQQIDELSKPIKNHPTNDNHFSFTGPRFKRKASFFLEFEGKGKANLFYSLYRTKLLKKYNISIYQRDYYALFDLLNEIEFYSVQGVFLYKRIHNANDGNLKPKTKLTKLKEALTLKMIYKELVISIGYLSFVNTTERFVYFILLPIKILNTHIYYASQFVKKLFRLL